MFGALLLVGEQVVPTAKRMMAGEPVTVGWVRSECVPKISGIEPVLKEAPRDDAA